MLLGTYYSQNYAGIIYQGLTLIPKVVQYCHTRDSYWEKLERFNYPAKVK